jgi:hypothetical protein
MGSIAQDCVEARMKLECERGMRYCKGVWLVALALLLYAVVVRDLRSRMQANVVGVTASGLCMQHLEHCQVT